MPGISPTSAPPPWPPWWRGELGRNDAVLGILGTGMQARLQARMHAEVLPLKQIVIWGRTPERAEECRRDLQAAWPKW